MAITTDDFLGMLVNVHGHTVEAAKELLGKYEDAHAKIGDDLTYWDMGEMLRAEGHDCEKAGCTHGDKS